DIVLDPFMGRGVTIREALQLGCNAVGVDLNPVVWFLLKTDLESVDPSEIQGAFQRLAQRKTYSGRSVQEELLSHYKTTCPRCKTASEEADSSHTFWVKSTICTNPRCRNEIPLFKDYIIAQTVRSMQYHEVQCPVCEKEFDREVEPALWIATPELAVNSPLDSAGIGRVEEHWQYSANKELNCPWCFQRIQPEIKTSRPKTKKIRLTVLFCPFCQEVWQYRGSLPQAVRCPACQSAYYPKKGNITSMNWFVCPHCGITDRIIHTFYRLPEGRLLPIHPYAIKVHCNRCQEQRVEGGEFFKKIEPADLLRYRKACGVWERRKNHLPFPETKIPPKEKVYATLIALRYAYWHQLFNSRQLLCLSILLDAIAREEKNSLRNFLLRTFFHTLEVNHVLVSYDSKNHISEAHLPPDGLVQVSTVCENNVWGTPSGQGFSNAFEKWLLVQTSKPAKSNDGQGKVHLYCQSFSNLSRLNQDLSHIADQGFQAVVTDVSCLEETTDSRPWDFFYVWLRLVLAKEYPQFAPKLMSNSNQIRKKAGSETERRLTRVWRQCHRLLQDDGLLVFVSHYQDDSSWASLLKTVFEAGFQPVAVYPLKTATEPGLLLANEEGSSYNLVHVCAKRKEEISGPVDWAALRQEIQQKLDEEINHIKAGCYGRQPLSLAETSFILVGRGLERFHGMEDRDVTLLKVLQKIRVMSDQLMNSEVQLPPELRDVDPESYLYLAYLCDRREIKTEELVAVTRGIVKPEALVDSGLIAKKWVPDEHVFIFTVVPPDQRFDDLFGKFLAVQDEESRQGDLFGFVKPEAAQKEPTLVDKLHFLLGLEERGEEITPWLWKWASEMRQLKAACEWLKERNKNLGTIVDGVVKKMDRANHDRDYGQQE
ncbi:MAG: hypothetical protein ONB05_04165, partial [candidate division KSB1 bacterium]|nr:hypothetical protein [candidate division KSB1 bacterium]